jgi:hypothetical protein
MQLKKSWIQIAVIAILILPRGYVIAEDLAEWTFLVYMQADNNLESFAEMNVSQMQRGIYVDSTKVNVLVQWDQPDNNKTWRYKVVKGGKIDAGSLSIEMGINPGQELIDCATWVKNYYPAKKYAWILWNHGSGIEDISRVSRGILYDDSQHTLLTNQALMSSFTQIKTILGQPIDLLAMDACLMAMFEISYQLKGLAKIIVASEQVEPGSGYAYDAILNPLTKNPTAYDEKNLANLIVNTYGSYNTAAKEHDFTASAFDMNYVDLLKANIDTFILNVTACKKLDALHIKKAVVTARQKALSFYYVDYIDLYTFYQNMSIQVAMLRKQAKTGSAYAVVLDTLAKTILQGMTLITNSILINKVGTADAVAKGVSIYYLDPSKSASAIDSSYLATTFAQQSLWLSFIKEYRTIA